MRPCEANAMNRRTAVIGGLAALTATAAMAQAPGAATAGPRLRIAIPDFLASEEQGLEFARQVVRTVAAHLLDSGLFELIDPTGATDDFERFRAAPRFRLWRTAGTQVLIVGDVTLVGAQMSVTVRTWDVPAGQLVSGMRHLAAPEEWRAVANRLAEAIYERFTGERRRFH
jgi:TolB protein